MIENFDSVIAEIIQGEAEILGQVGMETVAGCIATQIEHGWTRERIAASWTARQAPTPAAWTLAERLLSGNVQANGFEVCLSLADVIKLGCGPGEIVVEKPGTPWALNLFRTWPVRTGATTPTWGGTSNE